MSERPIARVVFACDAVGQHRTGIGAAARLASWLDAALHGIFIEDEALLHLADLPFARHIGASGGPLEAIERQNLLHQFEAHAARTRTAIEAAATAEKVAWSFDVVRGSIAVASGALGGRDLLVIEAESRPFAGGLRLDSRLLDAAMGLGTPLLVLRNGGTVSGQVIALVTDDPSSATLVIATAAMIAAAAGRGLAIFVPAGAMSPADIRQRVSRFSEKLARTCKIEAVTDRVQTLAQRTRHSDLLVLAAEARDEPGALREVLAKTEADVLFLR